MFCNKSGGYLGPLHDKIKKVTSSEQVKNKVFREEL
jgi:hypothetical protein